MKKTVLLVLIVSIVAAFMLSGCNQPAPIASASPSQTASSSPQASPDEQEQTELVVFAAASMTESMNEIAQLYNSVAPGAKITFNFDSSGTLKTQIQEGALCDIFISAGQKQMDQLDIAADPAVNTEGLDFLMPESRFNLVENEVVLVVPKASDKGIASFEDVATDKVSLIALGNSDVPAGQYAQEVFTHLNLWDALVSSNKISYGTNVKEVLTQVEASSVDCGIVYSTDAVGREVTVVASAPAGSHSPIVYPAAIIKTTKVAAIAQSFMEFLKSEAATKVLMDAGFVIPA